MDAHKLARNTDPASSHLAAREHVESGRNADQKSMVANALKDISGPPFVSITSAELAFLARIDRYMVARRLADLKAEGKVIQSPREEMRRCLVSGRLAVTWRLA